MPQLIPADQVLALFSKNGGQAGVTQEQFDAAVLEAVPFAAGNVAYRGNYAPLVGDSGVAEDCTFATTVNNSGFTLSAVNTRISFPSTGLYAVWSSSSGVVGVNYPVADLVPVASPANQFQTTVFGVAGTFTYQCQAGYVPTSTGAVTDVCIGGGAASGAFAVTNIATQYLRVLFTNNVMAATSLTQAGSVLIVKLRS